MARHTSCPEPSCPEPESTLDYTAFPHIFDAICDALPHDGLVALRATARPVRKMMDAQLARHVLVVEDRTAWLVRGGKAEVERRGKKVEAEEQEEEWIDDSDDERQVGATPIPKYFKYTVEHFQLLTVSGEGPLWEEVCLRTLYAAFKKQHIHQTHRIVGLEAVPARYLMLDPVLDEYRLEYGKRDPDFYPLLVRGEIMKAVSKPGSAYAQFSRDHGVDFQELSCIVNETFTVMSHDEYREEVGEQAYRDYTAAYDWT